MRGTVSAAALLLLASMALASENADALFVDGNKAYREERFAEAVALYERARAQGVAGGALYYNLGNAHFRTGDIGRARANYERARRFIPRDADLRANLDFLRGRMLDRAMVPAEFPLLQLLGGLAAFLTWREWLFLAEIGYALFLLAVGAHLLRPSLRARTRGPLQAGAVLLVLLLLLLGRALQDQVHTRRACVLPGEIAVRSGPGTSFTEEFSLHQGTVLRLEREAEGWAFVSITPDLKGWLPSDALEKI
ncbi:MAG: tetratricopeptide repeat protein [Candidatus Eisenbacteria bacterium]|nr:tetratricopeptide repeat protein [Candidatus Eisenbacteria bacterium]